MNEIDALKRVWPTPDAPEKARRHVADALSHHIDRSIARRGGRHVWRARLIAGMAVLLVAVVAILWPSLRGGGGGSEAAARGMRFPDGTVLEDEEIHRLATRGEFNRLRDRLDRYGVALKIDHQEVNPAVDGRFFGWLFYPGESAEFDEDGYYVVSEEAEGALVVVEIGRGSESKATSTAGLTLFEVHPEICSAIHPFSPLRTNAALEELGFRVVEWALLPSDPHAADAREVYDPEMAKISATPPQEGKVYYILAGDGSWMDIDPNDKTLYIEVLGAETDGSPMTPDECRRASD